jgi:hypothetical protein
MAERVILVGMGGDAVQMHLSHVQDRELIITGAFRYAIAADRHPAGRFPPVDLDAMVTGQYGLKDVEAALTASKNDPTAAPSCGACLPGESITDVARPAPLIPDCDGHSADARRRNSRGFAAGINRLLPETIIASDQGVRRSGSGSLQEKALFAFRKR